MPTAFATMPAVVGASPVTMTVRTPRVSSSLIRAAESERGGSLNAMSPTSSRASGGPKATAKTRYPLRWSSFALAVASGCATESIATVAKAPLTMRHLLLSAPTATMADDIFAFGSNGS